MKLTPIDLAGILYIVFENNDNITYCKNCNIIFNKNTQNCTCDKKNIIEFENNYEEFAKRIIEYLEYNNKMIEAIECKSKQILLSLLTKN